MIKCRGSKDLRHFYIPFETRDEVSYFYAIEYGMASGEYSHTGLKRRRNYVQVYEQSLYQTASLCGGWCRCRRIDGDGGQGDAGGDDQDGEDPDEDGNPEEKRYSQAEMDAAVEKRLAREKRKWQREKQKEEKPDSKEKTGEDSEKEVPDSSELDKRRGKRQKS